MLQSGDSVGITKYRSDQYLRCWKQWRMDELVDVLCPLGAYEKVVKRFSGGFLISVSFPAINQGWRSDMGIDGPTLILRAGFLTKCWLFQTRNPPLSLFLAIVAVVFSQFCSNNIGEVIFN